MTGLKETAYQRRLTVLEMVYAAKAGHIGGSMSCMDIFVSLYYGVLDTAKIKAGAPDRDRLYTEQRTLRRGAVFRACRHGVYSVYGGLGEAVAHIISERGGVPVHILGFPDEEIMVGKSTELFKHYGLDVPGIAARIRKTLRERVWL
jgi:deoxyxylulose-5-phosphate synthase